MADGKKNKQNKKNQAFFLICLLPSFSLLDITSQEAIWGCIPVPGSQNEV